MKDFGARVGRFGILVLLSGVVLGSCAHVPVRSADSLVGAWKGTIDDGTVKTDVFFEIKSDGTFSETIEAANLSFGGTYIVDPDASTLSITVLSSSDEKIVAVGLTMTQDISISRDGKTFKASGGGSTGVFTRQ